MRAAAAVYAGAFPNAVRTRVAFSTIAFQFAMRARVAVHAAVFHLVVRTRTAYLAVRFLFPVQTSFVPHRSPLNTLSTPPTRAPPPRAATSTNHAE
jgi:hypothetical protein